MQSTLALESLKDQLGFLVTIILDDDSLIHKTKTPKSIPAPGEGRRNVALIARVRHVFEVKSLSTFVLRI